MSSRIAIVTGASSGMGEALSRELVNRGWFVAMVDVKDNAALLEELGDKASFHHTNVASYDSQAATFQAVFDRHGHIDALYANAGIGNGSSIFILEHRGSDELPPAPDLLCTDIDWKGVVYGTQLAIHFMRKNKPKAGGVIVATASIAAMHPHPAFAEYNGAKAAVLNFVRGTAPVLKMKENIRINCVMPGIVHTNIVPPQLVAAAGPEYMTPLSTVTSAYVRLLDDENATGQAIECSRDRHLLYPDPSLLDDQYTKRAVTVWEPVFKLMHHEVSELPDAIPGEHLQLS
ncbi:hypothetical protein LTR85_000270 [Meristemomyces frigidus]|nr:hypothetical protein LTR85_000270 [Meristemomyces frigidus]